MYKTSWRQHVRLLPAVGIATTAVALLAAPTPTGAVASRMHSSAPAARSARTYLFCDDPRKPDYPSGHSQPGTCSVGLNLSVYDWQRAPGHARGSALVLRRLHWQHWGAGLATAHGLACPARGPGHCRGATVTASERTFVEPAGGVWVYQLLRVQSGRATSWYAAGVDA